jgi:hypothetical protein
MAGFSAHSAHTSAGEIHTLFLARVLGRKELRRGKDKCERQKNAKCERQPEPFRLPSDRGDGSSGHLRAGGAENGEVGAACAVFCTESVGASH